MWAELLGGGMLMAASAMLGRQLCCRERERLERLDGYCTLARHIASQIKTNGLEFGEIIRRCDHKTFEKCGINAPPADARQLCAEARTWLDAASLQALETVAAALEMGARQTLERTLDDCVTTLETAQRSESARLPGRCRVIMVLCLCGGALLTLLLL